MKIPTAVDVALRVGSGMVALILIPASLIGGLFATDAGTDEAMRGAALIAIVGIVLSLWLLLASLAPDRLERLLPVPQAMRAFLVRGLSEGRSVLSLSGPRGQRGFGG